MVPAGGVKICGIREPRRAIAAVEAGADLLGFVFAPSRRRVSVEEAKACIDEVRGLGVTVVGLFVDAHADEVNAVAERTNLDAVQLHGNLPMEQFGAIERPVIRVLRTDAASSARRGENRVSPIASSQPVAYLIDGFVPGVHGGTGVLADWALASELSCRLPLILAGGLTAENVADAIVRVGPRAVDVSSGVETEGVKDEQKIRDFVRAAKMAFRA
jgi:phosphoribosylanthranilate isomerase